MPTLKQPKPIPSPKPVFTKGDGVVITRGSRAKETAVVVNITERRNYNVYDFENGVYGVSYIAYGVRLTGDKKTHYYRESSLTKAKEITQADINHAVSQTRKIMQELLAGAPIV